MEIKSNCKTYKVMFMEDLQFFEELVNQENALFVIDKNVFELYRSCFANIVEKQLIVIEAKEENKVIETALAICERITEIPAKRNAVLISVGGGIIQDITGFVANITYRGIRWIFVPTTLLSACDSCIGGKTSLNYKRYKNLLGTFYPPDEIFICSKVFQTLSEKDFKSGMGEVIKFNIMNGENGLENIEQNLQILLQKKSKSIDEFVRSSLCFKKKFIEIDEFDRNERVLLNFAHTFGHAIEVVTFYEIPHGTAVAIGMVMADAISLNRGLLTRSIVERIEKVLLQVIDIDTECLKVDIDQFIQAMRKDKKQTSSKLTAVLISRYGVNAELSIVHDIQINEVEYAIKYFLNLYEDKKIESKSI